MDSPLLIPALGIALGFFISIGFRLFLISNLKRKNPKAVTLLKDSKTDPELRRFLSLFLDIINRSEMAGSNEVLQKKTNGKGYTIWFGSNYFSFTVLDESTGKFEAYFKIAGKHHDLIVTNLNAMEEFADKMHTFKPKIKPIEGEEV